MKYNIENYGKMPKFQKFYEIDSNKAEFTNEKAKVCHNSFLNMVQNNPEFEMYTSDNEVTKFSLDSDSSKINLVIARYEAYNGNNSIQSEPIMHRMVNDIQQVTGNSQYSIDDLYNTMKK
jgi:hypothetical protein